MAIIRSAMIFVVAVLIFAASPAQADIVNVDLSGVANGSWCDVGGGPLVNCSIMPSGMQTFNGQSFDIAGANGGNNAWFASVAANNGPGTVSVVVPVNVANVTSVYTLLNTMWGQSGASYDTVTFAGSAGASYSITLTGDNAIRDYNQYIWTNSISASANSVTAWNNYGSGGGQRLDQQTFVLPSDFGNQTLQTITLTDTGNDDFSRIFLAGLTVNTAGDSDPPSSVPEPITVLLAAGGLIGLGLLGRRNSRP